LKHYHSEAIDRAVRVGDALFHKIKFLAILDFVRQQALKPSTIISAFRLTGLVIPWQPIYSEPIIANLRLSEEEEEEEEEQPT
jgi:hypothetical protein